MKLKCIGGPCNGKYGFSYDNNPRIGECVKVLNEDELQSVKMFDPTEIPEMITIPAVMYIVDIFNYKEIRYKFLRLPNATYYDIFDILFK